MKTADLQDNMFNDYFIKPDNETSMNEQYNISTFDLISFAYQISSGMEYLASLQVVHRDLACRNILVDEGNNLKITDFGLSRMINNDSMYVKTTKGKLPLKWMAIESIVDRSFTTSSDVWSFGITLWEIATLGATPYPTIGNDELLQKLIEGYRMPKPFNCPNEVYEVMLDCWKENPEDRPSFIELRKYCDSLLIKETNSSDYYLDLSDKPGACPDNQFNTQPTCNNKAHSPLADNELFNHYVDAPSKLKPFNLPLPSTSPYTMSNPVTPIDGITISPIGNLKHSNSYDANNIKTL
jgi:serine/threonine protein kinase